MSSVSPLPDLDTLSHAELADLLHAKVQEMKGLGEHISELQKKAAAMRPEHEMAKEQISIHAALAKIHDIKD